MKNYRQPGKHGRCLAFLWSLMIALTVRIGCAAAERQLTVMVYMCGSNLESTYGSATADLAEMSSAGIDGEKTCVLVMTGGSTRWLQGYDPEESVITEVGARGSRVIQRTEKKNMGQGEALTDFLRFCTETRPAERYALILWDHGAGPVDGVCWDEQNGGDHLTLRELTDALAESPFRERKLDWIGFDACLMSSVEVAGRLAPYAEYMIASQAEEPATGWNYAFLKGAEADRDGAETGRRIVDSYFAVPPKNGETLTLACVDLSTVADVESGMDAMYREMAKGMSREIFSRLARMRQNATDFGRGVGASGESSGYDLVDLLSLCDCYGTENPEGAELVREATERAVVFSRSTLEGCCGLSVYHPFRNREKYRTEWQEAYSGLEFCPGYTAYVRAYGSIMTGERLIFWNQLRDIRAKQLTSASWETEEAGKDPDAQPLTQVTLSLTEEQAENLASARLVVLAQNPYDYADEAYFQVFSTAEVRREGTTLTAEYDGTCLQAVNESGYDFLTGAISYRLTEEGTYVVPLYPFDELGNRAEEPIWAEYDKNGQGVLELRGYAVYDEMTGMISRRADIDLSGYAGITFLNEYRILTRNEQGEILAFDEWTEDTHRDTQWKARADSDRTRFQLSFELDAAHAESLFGAYELTDTQGNYWMSELVPLAAGGMTWYQPRAYPAPELGDIQAEIYYQAQKRSTLVSLNVTNVSDRPLTFPDWKEMEELGISGPKVNGREVMSVPRWIRLEKDGELSPMESTLDPGGTGILIFEINGGMLEDFAPEDTVRKIQGMMCFRDENPEEISLIEFTLQTEIPVSAFLMEGEAEPDVPAFPEFELTIPTLDGGPLRAWGDASLRPAEAAENSRVLFSQVLENTTESDLMFMLEGISANGIPVSPGAVGTGGTGGRMEGTNLTSLAPGETGAATADLRYEQLEQLVPDVALKEIATKLTVFRLKDGQPEKMTSMPVRFQTEIPLNVLYPDAEALPTQEVVDAGKQMGAVSEETEKTLLDLEECRVSLRGMWLVGRDAVMLLKAENRTGKPMSLYLGQAEMDGEAARIGQTRNELAKARDRRTKVFGLGEASWSAETGAKAEISTGGSRLFYVSVTPEDPLKEEFRELSFHAFLYSPDDPLQCVYTDAIRLATEEAGPLKPGMLAVAEAGDYRITEGQAMLPEKREFFSGEAFSLPAELPDYIRLKAVPGDGERIREGYAAVFRRISSDRVLAEENIVNATDLQTGGGMADFSGGREWLLYEGIVMLEAQEDGSAAAEYPMIRPLIRTGYGTMPMRIAEFSPPEGKTLKLIQSGAHFTFLSSAYPGAVLGGGVGSVELTLDWSLGSGRMTDMKQAEGDYSALAGLITQKVRLIPSETGAEGLLAFLNENSGGVRLDQMLRLDRDRISFEIEKLTNPENLSVAFVYLTEDGKVRCTEAQPLDSFR